MILPQTATYYDVGVLDGYGQITHAPPEVIKVRWEENNTVYVDDMGEEAVAKAVVYSRDPLNVGGRLFLNSHGLTATVSAAKRVNAISITPSLNARYSVVKSWL